MAPVKCCWG